MYKQESIAELFEWKCESIQKQSNIYSIVYCWKNETFKCNYSPQKSAKISFTGLYNLFTHSIVIEKISYSWWISNYFLCWWASSNWANKLLVKSLEIFMELGTFLVPWKTEMIEHMEFIFLLETCNLWQLKHQPKKHWTALSFRQVHELIWRKFHRWNSMNLEFVKTSLQFVSRHMYSKPMPKHAQLLLALDWWKFFQWMKTLTITVWVPSHRSKKTSK